jgi:hypothetical protein
MLVGEHVGNGDKEGDSEEKTTRGRQDRSIAKKKMEKVGLSNHD